MLRRAALRQMCGGFAVHDAAKDWHNIMSQAYPKGVPVCRCLAAVAWPLMWHLLEASRLNFGDGAGTVLCLERSKTLAKVDSVPKSWTKNNWAPVLFGKFLTKMSIKSRFVWLEALGKSEMFWNFRQLFPSTLPRATANWHVSKHAVKRFVLGSCLFQVSCEAIHPTTIKPKQNHQCFFLGGGHLFVGLG